MITVSNFYFLMRFSNKLQINVFYFRHRLPKHRFDNEFRVLQKWSLYLIKYRIKELNFSDGCFRHFDKTTQLTSRILSKTTDQISAHNTIYLVWRHFPIDNQSSDCNSIHIIEFVIRLIEFISAVSINIKNLHFSL